MSEEIRAMYYPGQTLKIERTRFGMLKTLNISLYQRPVPNKVILKVDLLDCLKSVWGNGMLLGRQYAYTLLSGDGVDDDTYRDILTSCYKRFAAFANYCDECYYFGDQTQPLHERFLKGVTELVDKEREIVSGYGRVLAESEGYLYLAFSQGQVPQNLKGVVATYA